MNARHLFVDSVLGNDITAQINNSVLPWLTISGAISYLNTLSDTNTYLVYVRTGIYNENSLLLVPNIKYIFYFEPYTFINCNNGLFNLGIGTYLHVYGYGNFVGSVLTVTGNTTLYFECQSILTNGNYSIYYNSIGNATIKVRDSVIHTGSIIDNDPLLNVNSCIVLGASNNLKLYITSIINSGGGVCINSNVSGYNTCEYRIYCSNITTSGPIACNMLCYSLLQSSIYITCDNITSIGSIFFSGVTDIGTLLLRSNNNILWNISTNNIINSRLYSPFIRSGLLYCDNVNLTITSNRLTNINIADISQPIIYLVNGCNIDLTANIIVGHSLLYRNNCNLPSKVDIRANSINLFARGIVCESTNTSQIQDQNNDLISEFINICGGTQSVMEELQLFAPQLFVSTINSQLTINLICNSVIISNIAADGKLLVLMASTSNLHQYVFNFYICNMNGGLVYDVSVTSYKINGYIGNFHGHLLEQISTPESNNKMSEVTLNIGFCSSSLSNIWNSTFSSNTWNVNIDKLYVNMPTNFNSSIFIVSGIFNLYCKDCFINLPYTGNTFNVFDLRLGSSSYISINKVKVTGNCRLFKCGQSLNTGVISLIIRLDNVDITTSNIETLLLAVAGDINTYYNIDMEVKNCINRGSYTDGSLVRLITWLHRNLSNTKSRISIDANVLGITPDIGNIFGAVYFDAISPQGNIIFKDNIISLENIGANTYSIYATNTINARYYGYLLTNAGFSGINNPTITTNSSSLTYVSPFVV